jgi:hypothetical protein
MSPNVQVFVSLTRQDKETSKHFDTVAKKEAVTLYKQEFEAQKTPPVWQTIRDALAASKAMILLVGPQLVEAKNKGGIEWSNIQAWINYELGIAAALNLDVWVICDNKVAINFPVLYLNNYSLGIETKANGYEAKVLRSYGEGSKFEFGYSPSRRFFCPNKACGAKYNLHNVLLKDESIICPTCLKPINFPEGWQLQ